MTEMKIEMIKTAIAYPPVKPMRPLDPSKVREIAKSIIDRGLINPIIVRAKKRIRNGAPADAYEIVAGMHRYDAVSNVLKRDEIACIVVDADDLHAELITIDVNLMRKELGDAERAHQVKRRKELYDALFPEARHGGDRRSDQVANLATRSFVDATAAATGQSERTVRRDAQRAEELGDLLPEIAGTALDTVGIVDPIKSPIWRLQASSMRRCRRRRAQIAVQ
jgi:ParB family chromosome partitioning protein